MVADADLKELERQIASLKYEIEQLRRRIERIEANKRMRGQL